MIRIFRCVPAAALTTWIILAKLSVFDALSARIAWLPCGQIGVTANVRYPAY